MLYKVTQAFELDMRHEKFVFVVVVVVVFVCLFSTTRTQPSTCTLLRLEWDQKSQQCGAARKVSKSGFHFPSTSTAAVICYPRNLHDSLLTIYPMTTSFFFLKHLHQQRFKSKSTAKKTLCLSHANSVLCNNIPFLFLFFSVLSSVTTS